MASIHSEAEFVFVQSVTGQYSKRFWIGGTDAAVEGSWLWSDGSDWDYENWIPGQPDSGRDQNCLAMDQTGEYGKWRDVPCADSSSSYYAICRM